MKFLPPALLCTIAFPERKAMEVLRLSFAIRNACLPIPASHDKMNKVPVVIIETSHGVYKGYTVAKADILKTTDRTAAIAYEEGGKIRFRRVSLNPVRIFAIGDMTAFQTINEGGHIDV